MNWNCQSVKNWTTQIKGPTIFQQIAKMFDPLIILRNMNSNRRSVRNELPKYKVRQYSNKLVDFLIREAPIHNDLLAPTCLNYLPALPDFYLHVGIDELATTSTLFLLEVSTWIMKESVWSSRNNWKLRQCCSKWQQLAMPITPSCNRWKHVNTKEEEKLKTWIHLKAC